MERLGLKLEADLAALEVGEGALTEPVTNQWLHLERSRDVQGWQPRRRVAAGVVVGGRLVEDEDGSEVSGGQGDEEEAAAGMGDKAATVQWADVRDVLFTIGDPALRQQLLCDALGTLGAPLGPWRCSNAPLAHAESLAATTTAQLLQACGAAPAAQPACSAAAAGGAGGGLAGLLEQWMGVGRAAQPGSEPGGEPGGEPGEESGPGGDDGVPWFEQDEGRRQFLCRLLEALLGCREAGGWQCLPNVCAALLGAHASRPGGSVEAAREAARRLLAVRRDCYPLWVAYAALEAGAGQAKVARKVLDTALQALTSPVTGQAQQQQQDVLEQQQAAALLVVQAAELDLAALSPTSPAPTAHQQQQQADSVRHAIHVLQWFGQRAAEPTGGGLPASQQYAPPSKQLGKGQAGRVPLMPQRHALLSARRGYQHMLSLLLTQQQQPGNADGAGAGAAEAAAAAAAAADVPRAQALVAIVTAAALFEVAVGWAAAADWAAGGGTGGGGVQLGDAGAVLQGGGGVRAVAAVFEGAVGCFPAAVRGGSWALERLQTRYCALLAACMRGQLLPGALRVPPGQVHDALTQALGIYPHSLPLLLLLCECEARGHTLSRLRGLLHLLVAEEEAGAVSGIPAQAARPRASPQAVLLAASAEARRAGGSRRVPAVFEAALALPSLSGCALLWRRYLAHEVGRGAAEAARRVYLRAINACPGCKGLWLDGWRLLVAVMGAQERGSLMDIAQSKGLRLRTDVYEVLLRHMEGEEGA